MNEKLRRKILDFFFPTRCPVCGELIYAEERFCSDCQSRLKRYDGDRTITGAKSFTAAYIYDENVFPAIKLLKEGVCGNADYALGNGLADRLEEEGIQDKIDVIIPVPMYRSDEIERGFNQSLLVAKIIGKRFKISVDSASVVKKRRTEQQKKLDRKMRKLNLKGVYTIKDPDHIWGKRILLVDDISTTGSTLSEIASILLESGAAAVRCAACCYTPSHDEKKTYTQ